MSRRRGYAALDAIVAAGIVAAAVVGLAQAWRTTQLSAERAAWLREAAGAAHATLELRWPEARNAGRITGATLGDRFAFVLTAEPRAAHEGIALWRVRIELSGADRRRFALETTKLAPAQEERP